MQNLQTKIKNLLDLYKFKKFNEALSLNKQLIQEYPKIVILYNIMGLTLYEQKKIDKAINVYKEGLKVDPRFAMLYNSLGTAYREKKLDKEAEKYFKKSIELDNKIPEPQNNLGNIYLAQDKYDQAINCFKKAISINSNFFVSHYNLGVLYKNLGKFEDAKKHLMLAIKINKYFFTAHRTLSQLINYKNENKHFENIKELYNDKKIKDINKTELAFALGKACEEKDLFKLSYEYYRAGNQLRRNEINFSLKKSKEEFSNIKNSFNNKFFLNYKSFNNSDCKPFYIVGMPRSGTSLVEQILSTHSNVYGCGELNILPNLIETNIKNNDFKNLNKYKNSFYTKIASEYIFNVKKISNNSQNITDKLPINFKWIGFIKLFFSNSTIIHCKRNSKDTCFSIYKNYFTNKNLNFAYSLEDIVEFYNMYIDLMNFWKQLFPNSIITVQYEDIVNNPEKSVKDLLKLCNLPWEKKCLEFYNNNRSIKTASDVQVRKKVYKSSIESWKNYKENLDVFFKKLKK